MRKRNRRIAMDQWIKDGKGAIKWTRLPTPLAYNLGNFLRTLATLEPIKD
jgi:hypothetical protein